VLSLWPGLEDEILVMVLFSSGGRSRPG